MLHFDKDFNRFTSAVDMILKMTLKSISDKGDIYLSTRLGFRKHFAR